MGDDGHTASLFPGMLGLDQALASPTAYVAVDASGCPGSGPWPRRISLTPAGLEPSRMPLRLIRGAQQRRRSERADYRRGPCLGTDCYVRVDSAGTRNTTTKK